MTRMTLCAAMMVAVVLAADAAMGQIRGPARRAAAGAAAAVDAPGVGARIENREALRGVTPGDRWRYTNYGNQWWYYTPKNSWMYYQNNAWAPYDAATYSGEVPAAPMVPAGFGTDSNSWRYVHNGDQWWYYTPQGSWMYYGTNSWLPYSAGANNASHYTTGYRGTAGATVNLPAAPPETPVNPSTQRQTSDQQGNQPRGPQPLQEQQSPQLREGQPKGPQPPLPRDARPQGQQPAQPREAQPPQG